jgi:hypothetical protein
MRKRTMIRKSILSAAVAVVLSAPVAQAADEWGIAHEQPARWEAKVVDLLCEVAGDCPADCGAGRRQLGLLLDDGRLVPAFKNYDPFAGAATDLAGFCGKRVIVDGLFIDDPQLPMFAVQFKRLAPDGEWDRGDAFVRTWAARNNVAADSDAASEWFRNDETIKAVIARDGVYGIPGLKPAK